MATRRSLRERLSFPADKSFFVGQLFSSIADHYDFLNSLLSFGQDRHWRRAAVSRAELPPEGIILDVATGTGKIALEIAKKMNAQGKVIGVDFCLPMLAKGKAKIKGTTYTEAIDLMLAKAENLPFPDNTFDRAFIGFALRNVVDIKTTLQELTRVVKPGGKVVSVELTAPPNRLVKRIYYFYLFRLAPLLGGFISRKKAEYVYLPYSLLDFPSAPALKQIMAEVGLEDVRLHYLTLGIVAIHIGTKAGLRAVGLARAESVILPASP